MMKIFGLLLIAGVLVVSCKKKGCTDFNATNYDTAASKDDGSCTFEGSVVFWFDDTTSATMYASSTMRMDIMMDNVVIGSLNWNQYTSAAPNCGISGYTETIDMTSIATKDQIWYAWTPPDPVSGIRGFIDSGVVIFEKSECIPVEIEY